MAPGEAPRLHPLLRPSPGGPRVLQPSEGVGVSRLGGRSAGEGEGQLGPPGGQVLQAEPGAGGLVLLPPGGPARDGRHGAPLDLVGLLDILTLHLRVRIY